MIPGNIRLGNLSFDAILETNFFNRIDIVNLAMALTLTDPKRRPPARVAANHPAFDAFVGKCDRAYKVNAFFQNLPKGKQDLLFFYVKNSKSR
jgi:hypothetical protein